jgi:hypothetical protein
METTGGAAAAGEVGWYVLGPDQQGVGPYALVELRGDALPPSSTSPAVAFRY